MTLRQLVRRVRRAGRWLSRTYALELAHDPGRMVISPEQAQTLLPERSPRTGVIALEDGEAMHLALYVDARDRRDAGAIFEETSHLVCLIWHAARDRPVSRLVLELQAEVDRFAFQLLHGRDPYAHFKHFSWAGWLDPSSRQRYEAAHHRGQRYCHQLARLFPGPGQQVGLLRELRHFYRASPEEKLRIATL